MHSKNNRANGCTNSLTQHCIHTRSTRGFCIDSLETTLFRLALHKGDAGIVCARRDTGS